MNSRSLLPIAYLTLPSRHLVGTSNSPWPTLLLTNIPSLRPILCLGSFTGLDFVRGTLHIYLFMDLPVVTSFNQGTSKSLICLFFCHLYPLLNCEYLEDISHVLVYPPSHSQCLASARHIECQVSDNCLNECINKVGIEINVIDDYCEWHLFAKETYILRDVESQIKTVKH